MASKIQRFLVPKHRALNPIQREPESTDDANARKELAIHTRFTNSRKGPETRTRFVRSALAGKRIKPSVGGDSFEPTNNQAYE